jgi:hypothetical protein
MATIAQHHLFSWDSVDELPDLARIRLVLESMPDELLVQKLEERRGKGRDDFPVRAMLNLVVTFLLTGHISWASHLRELYRNRDLANLCGFIPFGKLPRAHNLSRFLAVLLENVEDVLEIFHALVSTIGELIPDFGKRLAVDSKAIRSCAVKSSEKMRGDGQPDRRGEHDASVAQKTQFVERENGTVEELLYEWFGFKLHLTVDAEHQLPVAFELTGGLEGDSPHLRPLLEEWGEKHPQLAERTEEITADKAYDSTDNILAVQAMGAELLCPTRKLWQGKDGSLKDSDDEIKLKLLLKRKDGDLAYDQDGQIYCAFQAGPEEPWTWRPMVFKGYEADRQAVKYTCPARAYGVECPSVEDCPKGYKTQVRVKLSDDPRIFVPTPRHTIKFARLYNRRTAVERVNGVLDTVFGFELHTVRGLPMTRLRVALALCAMLAMAVGRIRAGQHGLYRSLVRAS